MAWPGVGSYPLQDLPHKDPEAAPQRPVMPPHQFAAQSYPRNPQMPPQNFSQVPIQQFRHQPQGNFPPSYAPQGGFVPPQQPPFVPYQPQLESLPNPEQTMPAAPEENTIDESVWKTFWRDLVTIGVNVRAVLIPINWKFTSRSQGLSNWDLWGPLIFMLVLAIVLSAGEENASAVFAMVFSEVALGACILCVNVILLGGELVFFQAICLLGYCLFPLVISAIVCASVENKIVRGVVTLVCFLWASWATVPFIGNAVPRDRKALAVYPVMIMYVSLAWLGLMKS